MRKNLLLPSNAKALATAFMLAAAVLFSGCGFFEERPVDPLVVKKDPDTEMAMQEMVDTDIAFSEASAKEGMKKAFLYYVADDAVLLRPGYLPIVEGDVIQFLKAQEDTSFTMTWVPKGADMSVAHDLGYTYGVYTVKTKDTTMQGTYLSIWKKQRDGKWKFVVDTGNQGVGEGKGN